ncbi:caspase 3 [Penaeus vannamei]|uniref:Caspase 3 n=1 Tax=Penaeus vannamei TaxID=6689 RepID=A0A3R7MGC8_PENVA|nr:caspase 3 [Penaeus vannamei]
MDITIQAKDWLSGISPVKKAKLFFFSTHANAPSSTRSRQEVEEIQFPLASAVAFKNLSKIDESLEKKATTFYHHNATEETISETDYEYLSFFSACKYLDVVPSFLSLEKVSSIQDKFEMEGEERDYRLLLDSADIVLEKVCNSLKPTGVAQIWTALRRDSFLVKECLRCYPVECYPFGFCLILSVHKNRDGANKETDNVLAISKHLGMISHKALDPTKETIESFKNELMKPKYRFYSSFTCWFMAHGDEESMEFADGNTIERKEFLKMFSNIESFQLKPKVFFMVSCLGTKRFKPEVYHNEKIGRQGDHFSIGSHLLRNNMLDIPDGARNISQTQPFVDMLVAYSTMPDNILGGIPLTDLSMWTVRAC